ncbi:MAG: hypothetical protein LUQ31_00100, partial [Methanoregula sp.]|nr:hypothetical protein [Methanoregula sp.]
EHFEELQKKFDALTESYGAQGQKCSSLETDLGRLTSKNSEFEAEIKSLLDRIDTATKALEDEKRQRLCIEKNQKELAATKEREDREYEATIGALRNEQDLLKADLVRAGQENDTLLAAKQDLEEQLSAAVNAGAQSDKLSKSTASELEQANDELETERRLRHTAEENTLQAVQAKDSLEKEIRERDERIQELAQESESHKQSHGSLEEKVSELSRLYKESEDALGQAAADLETERSLRSAKEESLSQVTAAQEAREKELLAALEEKANELRERDECIRELTEESESHKQSHGSLEENVSELSRLYKVSEDALGQASADLETERSLRSAKEESFSQIQQEKSALEQKISNLETLAARIPVLESDLVAERGAITEKESGYEDRIKKLNERLLTEQDIREKSEAALRESAAQKQELEEKLAAIKLAESSSQNEQLLTATKRMQSLEEQLLDSEHEQAQKENALQDLSAKTGQIMAQLEEEREHHRKTREDLAEAHKALALSKKPVIPGEATQENDIRSHAIIRKTPELPAVVRHESHALPVLRMVHTDIKPVIVETPVKLRPVEQSSEPHIQIRSIEDLFEDPTETQDYGIHNVADSVRSTLPEPEEKGINENAIPEPGKMIPDTNTKEKTLPESENDNKNDGNPEYPDSAASPEEDKSDEIEISGEEVREEDSDNENSEDDENTEEEIDALSDTDGHVTITGESVNPQQWLELVKWAHNAPGLTREQRIRIFKFGRLIQKGKRLTGRQEEQLSELLTLAHAKGYPSTR